MPDEEPTRPPPFGSVVVVGATVVLLAWLFVDLDSEKHAIRPVESRSETKPATASGPVPGDALLAGYGDPATPPIEDLRMIHRVITGYFSVIKDSSRFPIGGNADLAAALRGENANRELFIRADDPVFADDGSLIDRWKTPLILHPEAWRQLELRSAGPDRIPYNNDDVVLDSKGMEVGNR